MKPNEFIYPEYRSDRSETFGLDPDRNTACTIPYSRNPNWSKIPGILLNRGTLALSKPLFPFYTINITEKYKLKLQKKDIQDYSDNKTRFLVIGQNDLASTGKDKTSFLIQTTAACFRVRNTTFLMEAHRFRWSSAFRKSGNIWRRGYRALKMMNLLERIKRRCN